MPTSKLQRVQVDPLIDVETGWPFARLPLSPAQWDEISNLSSIPKGEDDARKSIEIALGMFRQFQKADLDHRSAAEIRESFRRLAKEANKFYKRFSELVSDRDAYTALAGGDIADCQASFAHADAQQLMQAGRQRVAQTSDLLIRLSKWFLLAANRIKNERRGPKAENVYWLVGNLNGIREQFTGKKIIRSYKDPSSQKYISYVCKIADPTIGTGTIIEAIKKPRK